MNRIRILAAKTALAVALATDITAQFMRVFQLLILQNTMAPAAYIWDQAQVNMTKMIEALNYFRNVAGIGLKLMTMTLLAGTAVSIIDGYHANLAAKASMDELLVIFVVLLVLVILINTIPNVMVGFIPGGGVASEGSSFGAGAIMGAGMAEAGMAMGAAASAVGGGSDSEGSSSSSSGDTAARGKSF